MPVHYIHEKVVKGIVDMDHIPTAFQPANPGTKPTSAPVSFSAYDYATGVRFYPPADSKHAKLVDIVTYNAALTFTIPTPYEDSPTPAHYLFSHNYYLLNTLNTLTLITIPTFDIHHQLYAQNILVSSLSQQGMGLTLCIHGSVQFGGNLGPPVDLLWGM